MELGVILGSIIKKRGLTQATVANRAGISSTALSQIVRGNYNPSPATLRKLSEVLEIPLPIIYFLGVSEDDVPDDRRELYRIMSPTIQDMIFKIFGIVDFEGLNDPHAD